MRERIAERVWSRLERIRGNPACAACEGFSVYLLGRLRRDACLKSAATLAYTTLLAIVPLMTISFSVLAAFPVFEGVTEQLRAGLVANLVPAAGEAVDEHLERFVARAAGVTAVGILGLAASALLLMGTVERSLNDIWRVQRPRPPVQRFMVYWTVLTLGPLLVGVGLVVTSYLGTALLGALEPPSMVVGLGFAIIPFLVQMVAFALLYAVVPHCSVPLGHAVIGGAVAAVLFETAKIGFGWFVTWVPTYEAIYGALAALPIFLIWIYISWLIILGGAEVAQALRGFRLRAGGSLDPRWTLVFTVRLLGHLRGAQKKGGGLSTERLLRLEPTAGEPALERALSGLREARLVELSADGEWLLARDLSRVTVAELYRSQPFTLPRAEAVAGGDGPGDRRLAEALLAVDQDLERALDIPLDDLYEA